MKCAIKYSHGFALSSQINVSCLPSGPPRIGYAPQLEDGTTVKPGEVIILTVPYTGNPKPRAKWFKDGTELKPTVKYDFSFLQVA